MGVLYRNHLGDEVRLTGGPVFCGRGSALDWAYGVTELNGLTARSSLGPAEFDLPLTAVSDGAASAAEAVDRLADVIAADACETAFGRLYVGEWWRRCLPLGLSHEWFADGSVALTLTLRADDPCWVRTHTQELVPESSGGLDYPYDYPHDLGAPASARSVTNRSPQPCPVAVTVTGPAVNWAVRLGANTYRCSVDLAEGEVLTIDGFDETIKLVRADGSVENAFSTWAGTYKEGSGSFVFEQCPPGRVAASWSGCSGVNVTLYERRAELRWAS